MKIDLAELEFGEQLAYDRQIVQRQDELSANLLESFCEFSEIAFGEIEVVELEAEVGWIKIEQCRWAIVPHQDLLVRKVFDLNPDETLVGFLDQFREVFEIESGRTLDRVPENPISNQSRICVFLKVEESSSSLDIRKRIRILTLQNVEPFATDDYKLHVTKEFFVV